MLIPYGKSRALVEAISRRNLFVEYRLNVVDPPKLRKGNITSKFSSPVLSRLTPVKGSFPYQSFDPEVSETHLEQCFKIICKIGEGSFGNVFKVFKIADKIVYAAKVTKAPFVSQADRDKKINEVNLHFMFTGHKNIVTLYDAWEENGYLYMLMEYCEEALSDLTKMNHAIAERTVWKMLHDILQALDYIHSKGIIHMDVKMANIMRGQDGNFKLIDFGISCYLTSKFVPNMCGGDQRYLAPEIINRLYTKAADVFSLGVVTLEMAGDFILPHEDELLAKLRKGILPRNHKLSCDLRKTVESMLLPDYTKRPSAAELLANKTLIEEVRLYHLEYNQNQIYLIKNYYANYFSTALLKLFNFFRHGIKLFSSFLFSRKKIPVIVEPTTPDCTPEELFNVSNVVSATPPGLTSSGVKEPIGRFLNSASTRRHALSNLTSLRNSMSPARNLKNEFSSDEENL